MIKVLQINNGNKVFGGVSAFLLNCYRNIDRSRVQFDFLTPNVTTYEEYRSEIESMGGHVYDFHTDIKTLSGLCRFLHMFWEFIREGDYDIIHVNTSDPLLLCIVGLLAKRGGGKGYYTFA